MTLASGHAMPIRRVTLATNRSRDASTFVFNNVASRMSVISHSPCWRLIISFAGVNLSPVWPGVLHRALDSFHLISFSPIAGTARQAFILFICYNLPSVFVRFRLFARPHVHPSVSSVCPSVRPSVRSSVRPSVCPSVRPSARPSVRSFIRPSVRTSVPSFFRSAVRQSVNVALSNRLSVYAPSSSPVRPSLSPSVFTPVRPSLSPSVFSPFRPAFLSSVLSPICPSVNLFIR